MPMYEVVANITTHETSVYIIEAESAEAAHVAIEEERWQYDAAEVSNRVHEQDIDIKEVRVA